MKTDKFGDTIRRKLEGISPEFQESDWVGMQNYMRAHSPSTFWQRYGNWIGYAAAASVTTLMAFGYVHQLQKNTELVSDVKSLKTQIEDVRRIANTSPVKDTVYIVQKEYVNQPTYLTAPLEDVAPAESAENSEKSVEIAHSQVEPSPESAATGASSTEAIVKTASNESPERKIRGIETAVDISTPTQGFSANKQKFASAGGKSESNSTSPVHIDKVASPNRNFKSIQLETLEMSEPEKVDIAYKMNYSLHSRIAPRQVRKALHIPETKITSQALMAKAPVKTKSVKEEKSVTQAETVIPQLPIKAPYRFGAGMQFEKNIRATSVVGEVLVGKKFSISTGLTWLKVKSMEFYNEKVFREKNREDFKRSHPDKVPQLVQVYNINVEPTSVQIPLTVAFRNTIANKVDYYVSAGTNITIKSNEKYTFDCVPMGPGPGIGFFSKTFENRKDVSPINSVNLSVGLEKSWHPIVLQAEGYLYTYFTPLSPLNNKSGPGFRVKLLYQIGKKY